MLSPHLGAKNEGRMVMFYVKEKTDEIEVEGIRYLACRLDVKNAFILAMIPMEEIICSAAVRSI